MKIRKKIWRVLKPLLLIGGGLMIGIILVASNSSTVVYYEDSNHNFNHHQEILEHELEIELQRMEMELERMTSELVIPAVPEIPAIPSIPGVSSSSDQVPPIIVTNHSYESFDNYRMDMGETMAIVGGLGLSMLFLMGFILLLDEFRGRRFRS